jgi:GNAT superfamily N-acetyltransferase
MSHNRKWQRVSGRLQRQTSSDIQIRDETDDPWDIRTIDYDRRRGFTLDWDNIMRHVNLAHNITKNGIILIARDSDQTIQGFLIAHRVNKMDWVGGVEVMVHYGEIVYSLQILSVHVSRRGQSIARRLMHAFDERIHSIAWSEGVSIRVLLEDLSGIGGFYEQFGFTTEVTLENFILLIQMFNYLKRERLTTRYNAQWVFTNIIRSFVRNHPVTFAKDVVWKAFLDQLVSRIDDNYDDYGIVECDNFEFHQYAESLILKYFKTKMVDPPIYNDDDYE